MHFLYYKNYPAPITTAWLYPVKVSFLQIFDTHFNTTIIAILRKN